ncbi:MAG: hypothetical protein CMD26_02630 [Flavobacteriales bacterium]|nr:hypothetical protein [Flavobacteriales bacterium]|tara:strand:+ start:18321 stop:19766 length:1446 start_codon:yes stop_codon:yes gene_type:complete
MIKVKIIIFFVLFASNLKAQLDVYSLSNNDNDLQTLLSEEVFGCDVNINNLSYVGNIQAIGGFSYLMENVTCDIGFGLDRGLIMTTGDINNAVGPNNDSDSGQAWNEEYEDDFLHNYLVDANLITPSVNLYDACVVEFDISSDSFFSIDFEVVFGSEEYTEWMNPFYTDAFCFFVSEISEDIDPLFDSNPVNIMETGYIINNIPSINSTNYCEIESHPIAPWTIRPYSQVFGMPGINECLYIDNQSGYNCDELGYDGYTIPMLFNFTMVPSATYHVKMVIIDGVSESWAGLDSGVFIKKSNLNTSNLFDFTWSDPEYNSEGAMVTFNNISSSLNNVYLWDFNSDGVIDSTDPNPTYLFQESGSYVVTLQVESGCNGIIETISYDLIVDSLDMFSLHDMPNSGFSLYPNPAHDELHISGPSNIENYFIELVDMSGRILHRINGFGSQSLYTIDISHIESGVYYLRINNHVNQNIFYEKICVL